MFETVGQRSWHDPFQCLDILTLSTLIDSQVTQGFLPHLQGLWINLVSQVPWQTAVRKLAGAGGPWLD